MIRQEGMHALPEREAQTMGLQAQESDKHAAIHMCVVHQTNSHLVRNTSSRYWGVRDRANVWGCGRDLGSRIDDDLIDWSATSERICPSTGARTRNARVKAYAGGPWPVAVAYPRRT